jgi:hypothetical protein
MSGEDAPRPYLENLIVLEIKTNKQMHAGSTGHVGHAIAVMSSQELLSARQ